MILNIETQRSSGQTLLEDNFTGPVGDVNEMPETGNRYRRVILPPGTHDIRYKAVVDTHAVHVADPGEITETPVAALPFDGLPHLYASRYCPSDQMARFARRQSGAIASGHEKVQAICNWIFENVDYLEGSSDSSTSAHDTFTLRAGVCRDFAHFGITLTRAVGISARFVSAYALELTPQDFHAVFESCLGGR
ncbi:MAG: transglutaminase domain-containing protein [Devosia sp.]|nr:transglutaminase-like domain-containing protein [Devosia sp.]MBN9311273.1 transglutaminase domain-containing protein [Devosia sp.]